MTIYRKSLFFVLALSVFSTSALADKEKILFPKSTLYAAKIYFELLQKALHAAGDHDEAALGKDVMTEGRWLQALQNGDGSVRVAFSSATIEREKQLLPIRIPIDKGILGYRLSFIKKQNAAKIDKVKTIKDLRSLSLGQGVGWGDVELYEKNGMKVQTALYENLFAMAASGRFDIYPRGIGEIQGEFEKYGPELPDLAISDSLAIYYPWPYYFFVNKKDTALAERIRVGLEKMIKSGEFDQFFKEHYMPSIIAAKLKSKTIIKIPNPMLPPQTPIKRKELWYTP